MRAFWTMNVWLAAMLALIWGLYYFGSKEPHTHAESDLVLPVELAADSIPEDFEKSLQINDRIRYLTEREVFPCAALCHNLLIPNPEPRDEPVPEHEHIQLNHGDVIWCLNCHSEQNRDMLKLLDGSEVSFNETHRLCGQCHGPVYRDWRHGAHGQRTGFWNGEKKTWPCVRCHYPHDPHFRAMRPLAPPRTRFQPAPPEKSPEVSQTAAEEAAGN